MKLHRQGFKLLSEGGWVAAGQVLSALGQLIGIRFLTEFVSAEVFGVISLLLGIATLLVTVLCAPVFKALARFYAEQGSGEAHLALLRKCISRILMKGTMACCLAVLGAGAVYSITRKLPYGDFPLICLIIVSDVVRTMETSFMASARRQREASLWMMLDALGRPFCALIAVILMGPSTTSIFSGYAAASLLVLAICLKVMRREGGALNPDHSKEDYDRLHLELTRYAIPMIPSAIVSWLSSFSDRYIIGAILGVQQAGIYSAGYGLISRPFLTASNVIITTLRPIYFQAVSNADRTIERSTMKVWVWVTAGVTLTGYVSTLLFGKYLCYVGLSEKFRQSAPFLHWIALGYALVCMSYVYNTVSLAYKKTWAVFFSELSGAVGSVAVGVPLTLKYGLTGAAMAVPIYFFMQLCVAWSLARSVSWRPSLSPRQ